MGSIGVFEADNEQELEDLEDSDTWDMYDEMLEVMGVSELFTNLTKAAGYDDKFYLYAQGNFPSRNYFQLL